LRSCIADLIKTHDAIRHSFNVTSKAALTKQRVPRRACYSFGNMRSYNVENFVLVRNCAGLTMTSDSCWKMSES